MPDSKSTAAVRPPSQRELFALIFPLALSGIFFPLGPPVISAALARTREPELALAAYSVAFSVTTVVASCLFGLRHMTAALGRDRDILSRMARFSLLVAGVATAILLVVSQPPAFSLLVERLLGIPAEIARLMPPALVVMAFNPLLSVGRGFHQGILVRNGTSGPIGIGALGHLVGVSIVMVAGIAFTDIEGPLLAALALFVGQIAYMVLVWLPCRPIIRKRVPDHDPGFKPEHRTYKYVVYFYMPVAVSILLTTIAEPALQTGMARTPLAGASLAAYPICFSLLLLAEAPLSNAMHVVIASVKDRASFLAARRFLASMAAVLTLIMGMVALPPAKEFVFGSLFGISGHVKELAMRAYPLLVLMPLIMSGRSLYLGGLVARYHTAPIRSAAMVQIIVLVAVLCAGVIYGQISGLIVALCAKMSATSAEVLFLRWHFRRLPWASEENRKSGRTVTSNSIQQEANDDIT